MTANIINTAKDRQLVLCHTLRIKSNLKLTLKVGLGSQVRDAESEDR